MAHPTASDLGWTPGSWHFTSVRTLRPEEWRGKLRTITPRMVEELTLLTHADWRNVGLQNGAAARSAQALTGKWHDAH
jgi:hypothetical protein